VRRFAVLALLVGCYGPSIAPGAPCETECPGDLVCIDQVCHERGYVPRTDAAASDAFVPAADAAVSSDASQTCSDLHDEDGDGIGDACEPCPHLAGTSADGDGDGVGDASDPQPAVAKQRIAFFDPFTSDRPE